MVGFCMAGNPDGARMLDARRLDQPRGRGFEPSDRAGAAAVAVVNETMVRQYFAGRSVFEFLTMLSFMQTELSIMLHSSEEVWMQTEVQKQWLF